MTHCNLGLRRHHEIVKGVRQDLSTIEKEVMVTAMGTLMSKGECNCVSSVTVPVGDLEGS